MTTAMRRWHVAAMLLPALLVVAGIFGLGMVEVVRQSLGLGLVAGGQSTGFTFVHYVALLRDREVHAALGLTLWVAGVSTALSVIGGVGLALALHRGRGSRRGINTLLQTPLALPHLVVALATIAL